MSGPNQDTTEVYIGIGEMGGAHLETGLRIQQRATSSNRRIGICTRSADVRAGNLRGHPQGNNLGVKVRDQIEPSLMADIRTYETVGDVLRDKTVSAVYICRETRVHCELATLFLNRGIHVFVEKPFGLNPSEALATLNSRRSDAVLAVGQILPFFPQFAGLVTFMSGGHAGTLKGGYLHRMVCASNGINKPENKSACRSAWFDLAVHDLHLLRLLFGRPVAIRIKEYRLHPDDPTFVSWAMVEIVWADGATVVVECGAIEDDSVAFQHGYTIETSSGEVVYEADRYNGVATTALTGEEPRALALPAARFDPDIEPLALEQTRFAELIANPSSDAGALEPSYALDAVILADTCEQMILQQEPSRQISWPTA
ncbi:MAG: Gfo/Idh/MocA family oxidoreductase [Bdellovibrionota bacterium]